MHLPPGRLHACRLVRDPPLWSTRPVRSSKEECTAVTYRLRGVHPKRASCTTYVHNSTHLSNAQPTKDRISPCRVSGSRPVFDTCVVSRNSVIQSGLPDTLIVHNSQYPACQHAATRHALASRVQVAVLWGPPLLADERRLSRAVVAALARPSGRLSAQPQAVPCVRASRCR